MEDQLVLTRRMDAIRAAEADAAARCAAAASMYGHGPEEVIRRTAQAAAAAGAVLRKLWGLNK